MTEIEPKSELHATPVLHDIKGNAIEHSEVLDQKELLQDAYQGEDHEHQQTLWSSAKEHPMACMWAFIMCFTIVCRRPLFSLTI